MPTDWAPDGQRLLYTAFGAQPLAVWIYSFADRTHRRVTSGGEGHWLLDGRRFLYVLNFREIRIFDTTTEESRVVLTLPGERLDGPNLAMDDSQLFFMRATSEADIALVRFGDQK